MLTRKMWDHAIELKDVMVTTSLKMTNKLLSKLKSKVSCGNHRRT